MNKNTKDTKVKKQKRVKARVTWGFNPITRVVPSKKIYNRKRDKLVARKNSINQ